MSRFEHIIFVCTNAGKPQDTKKRCAQRGAEQLLERLKEQVTQTGRKGRVRVVRSGCLDLCGKGCALVAYAREGGANAPRETWMTHLAPEDAEPFFAAHVEQGIAYVAAGAPKVAVSETAGPTSNASAGAVK